MEIIEECRWPKLSDRYSKALRATVAYILDNFDVHGIIVSGSIIRGNPNAGSDFDTVVIHAKPERQRIQKFFHGVPAEIFVNPPAAIRSYMRDEQKSGRPSDSHMLTTGFVILDRDPIVQTLIQEAQVAIAKRPELSQQALTFKRYFAVDCFENAVDIAQSDPANASLILHKAVQDMIDYHFLATNQWQPRVKEMLAGLAKSDAALGALAYQFYDEADLTEKFKIAEALAQRILGETGFFEWASYPEAFTE